MLVMLKKSVLVYVRMYSVRILPYVILSKAIDFSTDLRVVVPTLRHYSVSVSMLFSNILIVKKGYKRGNTFNEIAQ